MQLLTGRNLFNWILSFYKKEEFNLKILVYYKRKKKKKKEKERKENQELCNML